METASSLWSELEGARAAYLDMAIECSRLTIPTLIPDTDVETQARHSDARPSRHLYQSLGSRGLSNFAAQALNTLFPFDQPFYRLTMDEALVRAQAEARGVKPDQAVSKIDGFLASAEIAGLRKFDKLKARASLFEALKHLGCGGTGLLYATNAGIRFYGLRSIVGERDADDNVTEIVIRERLSKRYLPKVAQRMASAMGESEERGSKTTHDLYTRIRYSPGKGPKAVQWHQEYGDKILGGTAGFSSLEKSPWIPLRLNKVSGSFYGTGIVEELLGDLTTYNNLSKAMVQAGLGAAKTIFLVDPNGTTRVDACNRANNFDFVPGKEEDVKALTVGKQADYQTGMTMMQGIERRLNFSFLMTQAIQRDAERQTAEEWRIMAAMLDESQGGLYTLLSDELQLPLIRRILHLMMVNGELQDIPDEVVEPQITAGASAIGRGSDKQRLVSFYQFVQGAYGPEAPSQYTNPLEGIRRAAAAEGVVQEGLLLTEEDLQAKTNQNQQLQLASTLAQQGANVIPPPPTPTGSPAPGTPAGTAGSSVTAAP
jgi:hypothetical protein